MSRASPHISLLLKLPIIAVILLQGCDQPTEVSEIVRPARVIRIAQPQELNDRTLPGRAEAVEEVNLSFDVAGTILERSVAVGDLVVKDQILARLDARDYNNLLDASIAARNRAKANFERIQIAEKSGAVSRQELDDARAQFEVRQADVKIKQKAVEDSVIMAPRAGTISATYVEAFTAVNAKQPILRLLDTSSIEMVIQVPETLISLATNITQAWVEFDAFPNKHVAARITEIGNEASQTTRTYPITLSLEQPEEFKILPGMTGKAKASISKEHANSSEDYQVPLSAVFTSNLTQEAGKSFVWLVNETTNTIERREVETDHLTKFGITISTGIESGDLVVISGVNSLVEGQKIRPTNPSEAE